MVLSDVCETIKKVDPRSTGRNTVKYVDIGSVDGSSHRLTDVNKVPVEGAPSRCRQPLQAGDTVFSTVRPYLEKIAYIDSSLDGGFASTGFCVLRPSDTINSRYLFHYATSPGLLDQVLPLQRGVSYPAVLDKQVRASRIPVPPLDVQRQIVGSITDLFRRMEVVQDAHTNAVRKLKSMILRSASDEVGRVLERHTPRHLGEHSLIIQYGTSAKATLESPTDSVPIIRMGNIQDGTLRLNSLKYLPHDHPDFPKLFLKDGDLLFNRTNSPELVGKSAVYRGDRKISFASYLIRVRFDESVLPEWANLVINSPYGRRYIESVTTQQVGQANVNGKKLSAFPLPVPPLEQQRAAIERHDRVVEAATLLSRQMTVLQQRTEALRRSVLTAAFEGRLTAASVAPTLFDEKVEALV